MLDRTLPPEELQKILYPFYEPIDPNQASFCVDGRQPEDTSANMLYPQTLGGVYQFGVLEWIINPKRVTYQTPTAGIETGIQNVLSSSISLGIHGDSHARSPHTGCGFGDRQQEILETFLNNSDQIWNALIVVSPDLAAQREIWDKVIEKLNTRKADFSEIPNGEELSQIAKSKGAHKQILEGGHVEIAAVVNLVPDSTLNKGTSNGNKTPAFNLDLWYVERVLAEIGWEREHIQEATLLSLGLYAATERVLRADKDPLPILVKKE